ncbi:MAG: peptidylprolyl isomerase [Candidatus Omnitrophota bacterium]
MLKILYKKKIAKKIWIVLAIMILPAFVLWGSSSMLKNKGTKESGPIGEIFGQKISSIEYRNAYNATRNQAIMQLGDNFSKVEKYLNLDSQAWDRLILLEEAKKRSITASNQEVIALIQSYPFFKNKGQFDDNIYQEMVQYVFNTQPRDFEEQTRGNIILSKLFKALTSGVEMSGQEIQTEYEKVNEEASLYYISALPVDFIKKISTSEKEIKNYYDTNRLEFKLPLSFNLEYVVSESKDKIGSLLPHINKKGYYYKIVSQAKLELKETGFFSEITPIPGIGWSPQVLSLLPKTKVEEFLPVVQIDNKYYLFLLKEKKEPYIPEFNEIKDTVKQKYIEYKSKEIAKAKLEECQKQLEKDYIKNPKSVNFDNLARKYRLKSDVTIPFKYGSYIEGIGSSDQFWTEAKKLKENQISGIISLPSGFYITKLKSFTPIDEAKFKEDKEFAERLIMQKKEEYFTHFMEELRKKTQLFK